MDDKELNEEMRGDIKKILHILNGNGHIGLVAKVDILWAVGVFLIITTVGLIIKIFTS
jgi:hypothetical protein